MRFEHPGLGVPDEHDEGEVGTACKHKTYRRHMGNVTQGYTMGCLITGLAQNKQVYKCCMNIIINKTARAQTFKKSFSQQDFYYKKRVGAGFFL